MILRARSIALAALALLMLAYPAAGQSAAPPSVLSVEPARLEVALRQGEKHAGTLAVTNNSGSPISIHFLATDRRVYPGGRVETIRSTFLPTSAAQWLTLSPYEHTLAPRERKEFDFSLAIPEDGVHSGDYTAMLFAEVIPRGLAALSTPDRAGCLLVVSVPGTSVSGGKIALLSAPPERITLLPSLGSRIPAVGLALPNWLRRSQPLPVSFSYVNEGTARVRANANLVVSSGGRTVVTIPAGASREVFPGDAADFQATWPSPPVFGSFDVAAQVDVGSNRPVEASFAVQMFPWPYALASLVPLLALAGVAFWLWRRRAVTEFDDVDYLPPEPMPAPDSASAPNAERSAGGSRQTALPASARRVYEGISPGPPPRRSRPAPTPPNEVMGLERRSEAPEARLPEVGLTPRRNPVPAVAEEAADQVAPVAGSADRSVSMDNCSDQRVPLGRSVEVDRLLGAGLAAVELGAYSEASRYFSAVLSRDEGRVEAWLLKAGTTESPEEAERCLWRALALDPTNPWAVEGLRLLAEASNRPSGLGDQADGRS